MRVAVVGAGIVGVTTAYELAASGHEVTVFERRPTVAAETSFANAGVIAPGYVTPWAAPGMTGKVLRQLFDEHAAVRFDGPSALREWRWMWRFWRACRQKTWATNRSAMQRLAQFSRMRMLDLTRKLELEYEQMPGYLVLLRTQREVHQAQQGLALLREAGVPFELVDAEKARRFEPGLNAGTPLQAAIHLPQDGLGNCRQFAHAMKAEAQKLGANFRFETEVRRLSAGATASVETTNGERTEAEAVVVCAGVDANALLAPLKLALPLAPVYGYSITAPLRYVDGLPAPAPRAALMDEKFKVAISRLGQRVRVAGSAELGGGLARMNAEPIATLYRVLDDWFPGGALIQEAQQWKGARPMLPDGPPVIGASGAPGIWLNLGHGSSGWALACGSACLLADALSGREAPIDTSGLTRARWR